MPSLVFLMQSLPIQPSSNGAPWPWLSCTFITISLWLVYKADFWFDRDRIADLIRSELGLSISQLTLAQVLESATWKGGREIAKIKRPETGGPPIEIESDGTVFWRIDDQKLLFLEHSRILNPCGDWPYVLLYVYTVIIPPCLSNFMVKCAMLYSWRLVCTNLLSMYDFSTSAIIKWIPKLLEQPDSWILCLSP